MKLVRQRDAALPAWPLTAALDSLSRRLSAVETGEGCTPDYVPGSV
jgi:hypothetical protein